MRAIAAIAFALALLATSAAGQSPWKIVEQWKLNLGNGGLQIAPAYTSVAGMYVATTADGHVVGVDTNARSVAWTRQFDDVSFVSALRATGTIFVARYSTTTVLDAQTGATVWENPNITMASNLAESFNAITDGTTIVYRDMQLGYARLCAVNGTQGTQLWCDKRRLYGSPDIAQSGTFTAVFFDVNGSSYVANMDMTTGTENWFAFAPRVFTGSEKYVALRNGPMLLIVNSMTGLMISSLDVSNIAAITTSVFVNDQFFFSDGSMWLAAMDCQSGKVLWNVTAPNRNPDRRVELQRDTPGLVVVAVLSDLHTNFTRFNANTGDQMWTVVAMPTGMSLAPIHAWLGTDILYVRNVGQKWSAWGADSGQEISHGDGDLFLPRSVRASFARPHYEFYVTTNGGDVIDLRIQHK